MSPPSTVTRITDGPPQRPNAGANTLRIGDVVDGWRIEATLGMGGMGVVYRAVGADGARVALKVLLGQGASDEARLPREAAALTDLDHPRIVRLLGQGATRDGVPYLVLELLEGETLAQRLRRGRPSVEEALTILRSACDPLAHAHRRGLVHRDVKPSNLFLSAGEVHVLDFGIARPLEAIDALTETGVSLGTPGYMSPEQALGTKGIDARADVFSLGSVFYECLTGVPAFPARDSLELAMKVVLAEPRRVAELVPGLPQAIVDLLADMLAKDRVRRPADAGVVLERLDARAGRDATPQAAQLSEGGLSIASILVALPPAATLREEDAASDEAPESIDTEPSEQPSHRLTKVRAAVMPFDARLTELRDGTVVATIAGLDSATDQALRAARCALVLLGTVKFAAVALATGRASLDGRVPLGDAIERAAMLARAAMAARASPGEGATAARIDAVTSELLDGRFAVHDDRGAFTLTGELDAVEAPRFVLGKATPCVARDAEIATLVDLFARRFMASPAAGSQRAALVFGPGGAGKSRLLSEVRREARRRWPDAAMWSVEAEAYSTSTAFGLLAQLARRAAGIAEGEGARVRQQKVALRVACSVDPEAATRVIEFMSELVRAPFERGGSVELEAARRDPVLMGDQIRRAWRDWLGGECERRPVLIVLEDAHWADRSSLAALDQALESLSRARFAIVASSRPSLRETSPGLWADRGALELSLEALPLEGIHRLAREVLGERATDDVLAWIAEHSFGNPLLVEELIRAAATGTRGALPRTAIAIVQSRLERLPADARRVLRAASVFGPAFWAGGVRALVGSERAEVDAALDELVRREVVDVRATSRFPDELEYGFRHAIVQEAAYGTMRAEDVRIGHGLAAAWLGSRGETEAARMAEHNERAGDPRAASAWHRRAAEQALQGNDLRQVLDHAERAIDCGAEPASQGELRMLQVEAARWRGEHADVERFARAALEVLPEGGRAWLRASAERALASSMLGNNDALSPAGEALGRALAAEPDRELALAAAVLAVRLVIIGRIRESERLGEAVEASAGEPSDDPILAARIHLLRAWRCLLAGDLGTTLDHEIAAAEWFEVAGDIRSLCKQRTGIGFDYIELGEYAKAEASLRLALAEARQMGLHAIAANALQNLGVALARQGRLEEANATLVEALAATRAQSNPRMESATLLGLSQVFLLGADLARAEEAARAALAIETPPPSRCAALGALADVLLRRGRSAAAMEAASAAKALLDELGAIDESDALVRLVYAEALHAVGDSGGAARAFAEARARLLTRADKIGEVGQRATFLANVPENARTLALAGAFVR